MAALLLATAATGLAPSEASAANKAPVCPDAVHSVAPGGSRALPLVCRDPDQRPLALSFTVVGAPGHGTAAAPNHTTSTVRFTPDAGFTGTTTLTFRAFDGEDWSEDAELEIRVTSAQQAPTAWAKTAST